MPTTPKTREIEAVRRFNRFYTKQVGALREGLLGSPYPLPEARVIYEIAHSGETTATELVVALGLDAGYLSRLLRGLANQNLIDKRRSESDGRRSIITLSRRGKRAFGNLDKLSRQETAALLKPLTGAERRKLLAAMASIEGFLSNEPGAPASYVLRNHEIGDMGAVASLHGRLYAEEYGWDQTFEALVASIAADFITNFDADRERCWIVDMDGEVAGSAFVVNAGKNVAKLRLMIVDTRAQGFGLGQRLLDECLRFARKKGYKRMTLWTNDNLIAARNLYAKAGFELVHEERHHSFGVDLVGETWELDLGGKSR